MNRGILALTLLLAGCASQGTGILDFNRVEDVSARLRAERKPAVVWGQPEGQPSLTLLHFSDLHGDAENLGRIVEFRSALREYIDDAIHTGDAVACYWDDTNPWNTVPGAEDILNIVGNHDCWKGHLVWAQSSWPYDATQEEAYELILQGADAGKPFVSGWDVIRPGGVEDPQSPCYKACYYYKDYPSSGLRLVALDCMHYDAAQDAWFAAVLQDALQSGLQVIGVQHYPPQSGLDKIPSGFTELDYDINPTPQPEEGVQMEAMPESCFERTDEFISKGGIFVCWLAGHMHSDMLGRVTGHAGQFFIAADKAGEGDAYMQEDRTRGTRFQDAFNLVTVNPSRGVLFIDRIGCDRDQYMRSKKLFCYNYLTGSIVTDK